MEPTAPLRPRGGDELDAAPTPYQLHSHVNTTFIESLRIQLGSIEPAGFGTARNPCQWVPPRPPENKAT